MGVSFFTAHAQLIEFPETKSKVSPKILGKTVRVSRYFFTAINSTNDLERGDNSW